MAGREDDIAEHAILVVAVVRPIPLVILSMSDARLLIVLELDGVLMRRANLKQIALRVPEKSEHVPLGVAHFRSRTLRHIRGLICFGKPNLRAVCKPDGPTLSVPFLSRFLKTG